VVPATFDVTNTADILNQAGTLRNAIQQANASADANNTINILTAGTYAITLAPTNTNVVNTVITAGGTGFTSAPTVTFTGGGGTGAAGTALIANGAVVGIRITNAGTGYTTVPTITFTDGGGTGAAATAEVGQNDNAAGEFAINVQSGGSLTINNQSGGAVIIDGQALSRVFDINPNNTLLPTKGLVTFNGGTVGMTITNGRAAATDDAAGSGGDIREFGDVSLTVNNVTVSNGTAGGDGGGISAENTPFSTPWTMTLNNSSVINNHAQDAGGGIDEDGSGHVIINNSLISGNSTVNQSGGIWLDAIANPNTGVLETASLAITQSVISNNSAGMLGAGFGNAGNGTVTVTNSLVSGNVTHGFGGGFADENNLGTLVVQNSLFQNNTAITQGGGIFAGGPSTTITNSEFRGNFADTNGGALFLGQNPGGTPPTTTSIFAISNTTLANNVANTNGGGIEFATTAGSTLTGAIINSTVSGNSALGGLGGGIDVATGFAGTLTLTNDTVTNNFANTQGGGVNFAGTAGGTVKVQNSIIANNIAPTGPDVFNTAGTFTDLGNNVVGTLSGSTGFGAGTIVGPFTGGALVGGLRDNGGPVAGVTQNYGAGLVGNSPVGTQITVQTEALPPTSAARAKGATVTGITTDQRGFTRPGTAPDVGAFQFQNVTLTLNLKATSSNGTTTVTVTVTNNSANALPVNNSVLLVTLPAGLTANGPLSFVLPALAAGQTSSPFTVTATGTPTGANTVTATINSPDANPNAVTASVGITPVSPPPPPTPTPVGQLMVFAIGFLNGQLVLFFVDQKGQIFTEGFSANNFFNPDPTSASFFNSGMVLRNMAPTNVFGSPGIIGSIVDSSGNTSLATTVPLNFIAAAALNDLIQALQQPGA
jgi:predicted outer membrane repeat protein